MVGRRARGASKKPGWDWTYSNDSDFANSHNSGKDFDDDNSIINLDLHKSVMDLDKDFLNKNLLGGKDMPLKASCIPTERRGIFEFNTIWKYLWIVYHICTFDID